MTQEILENTNIKKRRRAAVAVALLTCFTMSLIGSALNLSIPSISGDLQVEASAVGWLVTGYMLTVATLSVPFGRLADIWCRKSELVVGIAVFLAGCVGAALAPSMAALLVMRVLQGLGAAMVMSTNTPILISAYPPEMRGRAIGYSIAAVYVGLSLGPVIGGILNHNLGWRSIFVAAAIMAAIALVVAAKGIVKEEIEGKGRSFDLLGNILYAGFIVLFMYGLSEIEKGMLPILITAAGVLLGVVFVIHELKTEDPALNISLFRSNIGYTLSNVAALMNYGATFAIGYLTSIYLQVVMGFTSQIAGFILITQPVIMAILTPRMGRLSDKRSPFVLSSIGMGFCALGTLFYLFINEETPLGVIIGALIITGIGFSFFSSPNTNAIMSCVEKKDYGIATSVLNTMRSIGQTTSMVIVTIIVAIMLPGMQITQASPAVLVAVIHRAFIIFTIMCIIGIFISLKRKKQ